MICNLFSEPTYFFFSPDLPGLLYYSHIPAAIVALLIGFFVFLSGRKLLLNRLLLLISICFSLWILSNLILWTNIHSDFMLFVWSFLRVLSSLISILCVYFIYVFLEKKDISLLLKGVFLVLLAPVIVLAPTYVNLGGFNITSCDAFMFEGFLFQFYRIAFGVLAMLWILVLLIRKYRSSTADFRKQIVLMGVGIESFLFLFFTVTFLAAYLTNIGVVSDSRLEFYGLFGMPIFMIFIGILIVRFKTFNAKLFATQGLVFGTAVLIGAQLFTATGLTDFAVTLTTFVLFLIAGFFLIQSVRREIEQRELIQRQEKELEVVNAQQENLLHFVSHEVKGYLGKSAAAFAGIVEGDFGPVPDMLKTMSVGVLADVRKGVATVMDILDSANLKKGTFAYNKQPFDFKKAAEETVTDLKKDAEEKKLALTLTAGEGTFTVNGDEDKIRRHVIRNIIDNSIKYTPSGSIQVTVTREGDTVRFIVQDTGVGITPEDMQHLFTEGGHGKDSVKVNVHSTGFGLFIAKQVAVAHGGTIKAESEGAGKGSRFTVELPAA